LLEAKGEPFLDYYFGDKVFYMGNIKNNELWDAPTLKCTT
jgi:hypothetical protein